jgi:transcriptional antiterminator NusG
MTESTPHAKPEKAVVSKHQWYLVRVFASSEDAVIKQIKSLAKTRNLDKAFKEFFVPKVKLVKTTRDAKGEQKVVEKFKNLFPGYLAIKMQMNENTWNLVRDLPKVIDFIGASKKPKPLSQEEMQKMFDSVEKQHQISQTISFSVGESVKIKTGSFAGFKGTILAVVDEGANLVLSVPVFNTETEVKLQTSEVEKMQAQA